MNSRLLVDSIVRQTTVLIAQLSTAAGIRAPLSHVADEVFLTLAQEIEAQGVGRKVVADMFGMYGWMIHASDLNGDEYPDLAMIPSQVTAEPGKLVFLLNQKDGSFTTDSESIIGSFPFEGGLPSTNLVTTDFDSDGRLDLLVSAGWTTALRNLGGGRFEARGVGYAANGKAFPIDMDWDGRVDVLVPSADAETVFMNTERCWLQ